MIAESNIGFAILAKKTEEEEVTRMKQILHIFLGRKSSLRLWMQHLRMWQKGQE